MISLSKLFGHKDKDKTRTTIANCVKDIARRNKEDKPDTDMYSTMQLGQALSNYYKDKKEFGEVSINLILSKLPKKIL